MSVKSTIKYGNTTIVDQYVESSDSIVVSYNGSTVATLTAGDDKKLNTKDKICQDYITIGSKILNCKDKLLTDYVECIVTPNGYTWQKWSVNYNHLLPYSTFVSTFSSIARLSYVIEEDYEEGDYPYDYSDSSKINERFFCGYGYAFDTFIDDEDKYVGWPWDDPDEYNEYIANIYVNTADTTNRYGYDDSYDDQGIPYTDLTEYSDYNNTLSMTVQMSMARATNVGKSGDPYKGMHIVMYYNDEFYCMGLSPETESSWLNTDTWRVMLNSDSAMNQFCIKEKGSTQYENVTAPAGTYPENGYQDGYWYVKIS